LWVEVKKETGRWKDRWKIRDLVADERCSRAVLNFLSSTDVGRRVPAEGEDAVSEVSEAEQWEWLEEQEAGGRGAGRWWGITTVPSHSRLHGIGGRGLKGGGRGCILSFVIPVVIPLVRSKFSWKAWAEGKGCLQRAATALTADRNRTVHNLAMI